LADWRTHQVVYQVFVDRFAFSRDPRERAALYTAPRRLRAWTDQPTKGNYVEAARVWQHEIDFWGGDLRGLAGRLDYIRSLGADVLYLNPIFLAYTNHKYDATDYFQIDPQYGTSSDFEYLCDEAHERGMRVVLDGVFNHTGRRATWFQDALTGPSSPYRDFYTFGPEYKAGYLFWTEAENLPELKFDNPTVRDVIYRKPDSAVQRWLKHADGWRLDVAFELGPDILSELTRAAHSARPDSYTVGEIYNYPAGWFPALDAVMNMSLTYVMKDLARGYVSGPRASEMVDVMIRDAGIEPMLRSWIVLSNHDRWRLKSEFPALQDREFLWQLMVTLPGAPLVYYGEELGFEGKDDPEMRGPMNWQLATSGAAPEQEILRRLLAIRNTRRALQVGDFVRLPSERLCAFMRHTASVRDTVVVLANPTSEPVTETIMARDSWLMDNKEMRDLFGDATARLSAGLIRVTVPPKTVRAFVPVVPEGPVYTPYKRVP
jgi:glycosidase